MQNKRNIGSNYEKIAGEYLEKQGYQILEYNFYSRAGEIDIIAKYQCTIVKRVDTFFKEKCLRTVA